MRFAGLLITFMALNLIGYINADKKFEKPKQKECVKVCPSTYEAICAGNPDSPSDRKISFGNQCVLSNYNCENNANLVELSKGECAGGGGVRLS